MRVGSASRNQQCVAGLQGDGFLAFLSEYGSSFQDVERHGSRVKVPRVHAARLIADLENRHFHVLRVRDDLLEQFRARHPSPLLHLGILRCS